MYVMLHIVLLSDCIHCILYSMHILSYTYISIVTRIPWNDLQVEPRSKDKGSSGTALPSLPLGLEHLDPAEVYGLTTTHTTATAVNAATGTAYNHTTTGGKHNNNDDDDEEEEEEEDDAMDEEGTDLEIGAMSGHGKGDNKCVLVWQGIVPKRTFTGFKFQVRVKG